MGCRMSHWMPKAPVEIGIAVSDETTALTGAAKTTFRMRTRRLSPPFELTWPRLLLGRFDCGHQRRRHDNFLNESLNRRRRKDQHTAVLQQPSATLL